MTTVLRLPEDTAPKDYALMYAGFGWKVFPVWQITDGKCACPKGADCDRPGKHPMGEPCPNGASDASSDRAKIEAWWGRWPNASIGIATGTVSGITVVDADQSGGKPGLINLTRLCVPNGGVPATYTVDTGGGGIHLYFNYNAALRTGANVLDDAIDVRNDGGYVVAPPSNHKSGGVYKWREEPAALKDVPGFMLTAPQEARERSARRRGRPRTREALPLEKVEEMLAFVDADDRDRWIKMGLLLGRLYVGTESESEAWSVYEKWSATSDKFDDDRAENLARMHEQFHESSQQPPRPGAAPLGSGTLFLWAKEGGWSPFGDKAVVKYEPGNEPGMCTALVAALVADLETNRYFNVMGEIRDVLRCPTLSLSAIQSAADAGESPPETLVVRRATMAGLQCALAERAVLIVPNATTGIPSAKPIPESLVSMILKARSLDFPALVGIAEWPMVSGGRMLYRARGFDAEWRLYFDIDERVRIDEGVSAADGWRWLCDEFLVDFPFENDTHKAAALAMMLAMMQRPLMETCPAFAVVAPQPGTGKGTLIEAAALAVHGSPIINHAFSSDEEELRKALHSLMIAKTPAVMFDNLDRGCAIASNHLAKMITAEIAADRTLGISEMRKEANKLLMTFTGNNISFVRDMATRVVTLRLNAKTKHPIGRIFRHPDLRAWVREERSRILSALVAIAKLADGEPVPGTPSRFADYDAMIVGPVLKVTGLDVRTLNVTDDVDAEEDEETKGVLAALWAWQQTGRGDEANRKPWRVGEVVAAIQQGNMGSFPAAAAAAIRRFAGDSRHWDNDPARYLGTALRSVRDGYRYPPYLLINKATKTGARWLIKNDLPEDEEPAPTDEAF